MQLSRTYKAECFGCDRETMVRDYEHETGAEIALCHSCRTAMDWSMSDSEVNPDR